MCGAGLSVSDATAEGPTAEDLLPLIVITRISSMHLSILPQYFNLTSYYVGNVCYVNHLRMQTMETSRATYAMQTIFVYKLWKHHIECIYTCIQYSFISLTSAENLCILIFIISYQDMYSYRCSITHFLLYCPRGIASSD